MREISVNTTRSVSVALFILLVLSVSAPLLSQERAVSVKIFVEGEFGSLNDLRSEAQGLLEEVSKEFEELFQIRFTPVDFGEWPSSNGIQSLQSLAEDLNAHMPERSMDIAIVFAAPTNLPQSYSGYSLFRDAVIALEYTGERRTILRTLKHEICHLFGAVHVANPDSIMDYFVRGDRMDSLNAELIKLNRDRRFNLIDYPLNPEHFQEIIEICERIILANTISRNDRTHLDRVKPGIKGLVDANGEQVYIGLEDVHVLMAEIYLESRQFEDALFQARQALVIDPDNFSAKNIQAITFRYQGDFDRAIMEYQDMMLRKPAHPQVLFNMGVAFAEKGDVASALSCYRKALRLNPNFAQAWNNMGETYLGAGNLEAAGRAFEKSVSLNPGYALAHANYGEALFRGSKIGPAFREAEAALALNPGLASAHNLLGNIYQVQNRIEEAEVEYQRAIDCDPGNSQIYFNLGRCRAKFGDLRKAREYYLIALETNPDFAEAHANLGYCYLLEKHFHLSISEITKAHELGFSNARTYLNLSYAYHQKDLIPQALEAACMSYDLDPELARTHAHLVVLYLKSGDIQNARIHAALAESRGIKLKSDILEKIKQ